MKTRCLKRPGRPTCRIASGAAVVRPCEPDDYSVLSPCGLHADSARCTRPWISSAQAAAHELLNRLLPLSVAQTHWKTGLFTPNANSSPGRAIDFRSRSREPASGAAEFDFVRHLETVEDVFANLCNAALEQLAREGHHKSEDVARLSALVFEQINLLSGYAFSIPEAVTRGELRPLRNPAEVHEEVA
jgi:hypothetical protein